MNRFALPLAFALVLLLPSTVAAADCQFVLGFATLRDLIGSDIVGECLENEHHNEIGDSVQQTTGGLMVWRKADNWTAFTDGYRTWVNGPNGLEQRLNAERFLWEAENMIASLPQNPRDPTPVARLRELARISSPVFLAFLERVGDRPLNSILVNDILRLTKVDKDVALQVVRMPFLRAPTESADHAVLRHARRLAQSDPVGLREVLSRAELSGGITDDTVSTFILLGLRLEQPEAAAAILAIPWVKDIVNGPPAEGLARDSEISPAMEESLVRRLVNIALKSQGVA